MTIVLRCIVLAWDHRDERGQRTASMLQRSIRRHLRDFQRASLSNGVSVHWKIGHGDPSQVYPLPTAKGLLLGEVFSRDNSLAETAAGDIDERISSVNRTARADLQELICSDYWGSYISLLCDSMSGGVSLLRSPMANLPCYFLEFDGVVVFFSRLVDVCALQCLPFTVNRAYVAAHLALGGVQSLETGLNEISMLEVGECASALRGSVRRRFVWHPCEIAKQAAIDEPKEAAEQLRTTTVSCVRMRLSRHRRVIHLLSGGLDSSIVLAAIQASQSPIHLTCLHYYWQGPYGDERLFARASAEASGCRYVEVQPKTDMSLRDIESVQLAPIPLLSFTSLSRERADLALARASGATAICCGELGDALFQQSIGIDAIVEFLGRRGWKRGVFQLIYLVALQKRLSVYDVGQQMFRWRYADGNLKSWKSALRAGLEGRQLAEATIDAFNAVSERFIHPWFAQADSVPAAKLTQIGQLSGASYYESPFLGPDDPTMFSPLASQPLADLCLRIPSYLNLGEQGDRATARGAFSSLLPPSISMRRSKGSPHHWLRQLVAANREFIREFLLDGLLVNEGYLSRRALEESLPGIVTCSSTSAADLIQHMFDESWLRAIYSTARNEKRSGLTSVA